MEISVIFGCCHFSLDNRVGVSYNGLMNRFKTISVSRPAPLTDDTKFNDALNAFVVALRQRINDEYAARYKNLTPPKVYAEFGSKNVRIVLDNRDDKLSGQRFVHCFIRRADGAILKAAGWKAPAKHPRGSIYTADHGMSAVNTHGAIYLR